MASILVVDDEPGIRLSVSQMLTRAGHEVKTATTVSEAAEAAKASDFDLVITDVMLPDGNGIDFVKRLRSDGFDGVVVVITAHGTIDSVVSAMKNGADDFLLKGFKIEEVPLKAAHWLTLRQMSRRLRLYERLEKNSDESNPVIGHSPAWTRCLQLATRIASVPLHGPSEEKGITLATVLLTGETGVGKGVLARYIHGCTTRDEPGRGAGSPAFVHVNCSALPAALVESELFGHERGAFTDARQARVGLFEMAEGGTIFLDEISEMPLELQAKLLLVVEQGRFRRVGGGKERTVRARVIAASNTDLAQRAELGQFRRDLFYRLSALSIHVPALREREGDAVLIAEEILGRLLRRYGREPLRLGEDTRNVINSYAWPGNVRELVNTMQRVAMLCDKPVVAPEDLGLSIRPAPAGTPIKPDPSPDEPLVFDVSSGKCTFDAVEKALLTQTLAHTRGNVTRTAALLGLTRASVRYRMETHGLSARAVEAKSV